MYDINSYNILLCYKTCVHAYNYVYMIYGLLVMYVKGIVCGSLRNNYIFLCNITYQVNACQCINCKHGQYWSETT